MSEGDVWSVHQPREIAGTGVGPAYPVMPALPRDPDYAAWLIAGVLFLLAGVLQAVALFAKGQQVTGALAPDYENLSIDVLFGVRAVLMLACGVLVLSRRTREWAGGLAVGFGFVSVADHFWQLRSSNSRTEIAGSGIWLLVAAFALWLAAAAVILVVLFRRRRSVGDARSRAERRVDRIVVVPLGFAGAVVWTVSTTLAWIQLGVGTASGGIKETDACCSWSQDDGWKQISVLIGGVTILALVLFAATLSSKIRAVGLLLGIVVAALPDVALTVVNHAAPMPALYGFHYRDFVPSYIKIVQNVDSGFWTGVAALLLLGAAAVSRLALGARKAAYPPNELERIAS